MDSSPQRNDRRRPARWAKRCEQNCMAVITRIPLVLVYGLTTWAVWVEFGISMHWAESSKKGYIALFAGVTLYLLLNWSYTTCAFTDPGSPLNTTPSHRHNYSHLPSHEPAADVPSSLTVKATGAARFCKKCQCKKPDRAHHCSSCRRCVLKMDHHCPWLATCVGLRNYKAFLLFLTYTTLFCWLCFGVSAGFVWYEIANESMLNGGALLGINMVLLAVLSGIIGLVLTGFTGWHISLAVRNQTTIECLEKTRYSAPIKRTLQRAAAMPHDENAGLMQRYGQQLAEIHANAIPGVTRIEEGEERTSPHPDDPSTRLTAVEALRMNYNDAERQREQERYEAYLDEKDNKSLPHAFDLGWRRNLSTLFGPKPHLWAFPICNSAGDGWQWEASPRWLAAHTALQQAREQHWREQEEREREAGWGTPLAMDAPAHPHSSTTHRMPRQTRPYSESDYDAETAYEVGYDTRPGTGTGSEMSMQTMYKQRSADTASLDGLYEHEQSDQDSDTERNRKG